MATPQGKTAEVFPHPPHNPRPLAVEFAAAYARRLEGALVRAWAERARVQRHLDELQRLDDHVQELESRGELESSATREAWRAAQVEREAAEVLKSEITGLRAELELERAARVEREAAEVPKSEIAGLRAELELERDNARTAPSRRPASRSETEALVKKAGLLPPPRDPQAVVRSLRSRLADAGIEVGDRLPPGGGVG